MRSRHVTRALLAFLSILLVFPVLAVAPAQAAPRSARTWMPDGRYQFIGHRGYPRGGHTENTLPAIRAAHRSGATAVEIDIHRTRDRKLILMHDPTLRRTTTCHGTIRRMRFQVIHRHCRGERHRERIPPLWRALRYTHLHHMSLIIEVKPDAVRWWGPAMYRRLAHAIKGRHMADRALVLSRSPIVLTRFRRATSGIPTSWIDKRNWPGARRASRVADVLQVNAFRLSRNRVRALHRNGTAVFARRTNSTWAWHRIRYTRADSVLVDDLPHYVHWVRSHR